MMKKPKTKKKPPAPSVRKSWHDPREVNRKGATPWNDKAGLAHAMKEIGPDNNTAHGVLHGPYPTVDDIKKAEGDGYLGPWPPFTSEDCKPFIDPNPGPRRDSSEVVAEMKVQRAAPKQAGIVEPLYSAVSQDAAKMRECLSECAKIVADAIVHGAKIIAGKEDKAEPAVMADGDWRPVGGGTPLGTWLETARITSNMLGTTTNELNVCMCRVLTLGDEPEWVEKEGGRTTVTHSTFAAPTHWRWPAK